MSSLSSTSVDDIAVSLKPNSTTEDAEPSIAGLLVEVRPDRPALNVFHHVCKMPTNKYRTYTLI